MQQGVGRLGPATFPVATNPTWTAPRARVGNIPTMIALLGAENHTPFSFVKAFLSSKTANNKDARNAFLSQLPDLLNIVKNEDAIKAWSVDRAKDLCRTELGVLRTIPAMRGDVTHLTVDKLEKFDLEDILSDMTKHAPAIVHVITSLLDIKPLNPNKEAYTDKSGKVNEDKRIELENKRTDLRRMRLVTIVGILVFNSNQRANALQTTMGVYLHANHTTERAQSTLHHSGICITRTTTHDASEALSKDVSAQLKIIANKNRIAIAFDNYNLHFPIRQDTLISRKSHVNLTTATAHILHEIPASSLDYRRYLYDRRVNGQWVKPSIKTLLESTSEIGGMTRDQRVQRFAIWQIVDAIIQYVPGLEYLKQEHGTGPGEVNQIPLRKDEQYPLRAMDRDEGSLEGVIGVFDDVDEQCGWEEPEDENQVRIFDGDLASVERANGAREHRETQYGITSLRKSCDHFVMRPGLFHLKISCVYAIHRVHMEKQDVRKDDLSLYGYIRRLKPDHSSGIISKPTFRDLHENYYHVWYAAIGDCLRLSVPDGNVDAWVAGRPALAMLQELAGRIYSFRIASMNDPAKDEEDEGAVEHNHRILLRDLLHYVEITHAMNAGDIGRLEDILPLWILTWKGTGQMKYAKEIHRFLTDLNSNFPPDLANAVRMGWLVNPTGKAGHWRGVDWVEEYDNLLIQNLCGNDSSNKTLQRILAMSNLIMVYRRIFLTYDESYCNISRTLHHTNPDMSPKVHILQKYMQKERVNEPVARSERYGHRVDNAIAVGAKKLICQANIVADDEGDEGDEVQGLSRVEIEE